MISKHEKKTVLFIIFTELNQYAIELNGFLLNTINILNFHWFKITYLNGNNFTWIYFNSNEHRVVF